MISAMLTFVKSKWLLYGVCIAATVSAIAICVNVYGASQYRRGVLAERAVWAETMLQASNEAAKLRNRLRLQQAEAEIESRRLVNERNLALTQVQEQIRNAESVEDQYAIYLANHDSLRRESAERVARARADYLSSLSHGTVESSRSDESRNPVPDVTGSVDVYSVQGVLVGHCLGER